MYNTESSQSSLGRVGPSYAPVMASRFYARRRLDAASYPDVSLLMKCARKERREGDNGRNLPSVSFPWPLAVHYQSLVSRSPLPCEKRSAWGGGWTWRMLSLRRWSRLLKGKSHELRMCEARRNAWKILQNLAKTRWWPQVVEPAMAVKIEFGSQRKDFWSQAV